MTAQETAIPTSVPTANAHRLFAWGMVASASYVAVLAVYAWSMRKAMLDMKPDQLATFLSGVFAPLAFLWLVLGFRQQGDELKNSAEALWLQGEELRNSVEQQRQLVEVSRQQLEAERRVTEEAERRLHHQSQPRLRLMGGGSVHSGGNATYTFTLTNVGPGCSDVSMHIVDREEFAQTLTLSGPGSHLNIEYKQGLDEQLVPIELEVRYQDSRGMPGMTHFHVPVTLIGDHLRFMSPQTGKIPSGQNPAEET